MSRTKNAADSPKRGGDPSLPYWKTRLYRIWSGMKTRCSNPNQASYKNYGARGIRVCAEWQSFFPFQEWALSHGYQDSLSIERIDINGNYCPENCKWANRLHQANNTRSNRRIEFGEMVLTSRQWDRRLGFREGVLSDRLNTLGWDLERTMTEPVGTSHARTYTFNGETHTISEWASIIGISFTSLCKRLNNPDITLEEALTKPKQGMSNLLTFQGKTLPLWQWAKELGIPGDTLWARIKHSHWPIDKALTTPVRHYIRHDVNENGKDNVIDTTNPNGKGDSKQLSPLFIPHRAVEINRRPQYMNRRITVWQSR